MGEKKKVSRRDFLQLMGAGAAVTTAALAGCSTEKAKELSTDRGEVPTDKMTYRHMPDSDRPISLLGYGMMRLPVLDDDQQEEGKSHIDQDEVNSLVDYAIAHGVNYFDTSPRYCKGFSEQALGIALSKHKRSEFVVATKLSNFATEDQTLEASIAMYRNSFKQLRVDYIDYYLLHAIGEKENYLQRYVNNGVLNFLLNERAAGRIKYLGWSFHGTKEFFDYMLNEQPVKFDFVQIQMNYKDWHYSQEVNADYLYHELAKRNIPVVIMEPLLGGGLAKVNHKVLAMFQRIAPNLSPAYWAFRFCGSYPGILTVLSGMSSMDPLIENVETFSHFKPLTEEEISFLQEMADLMENYPTIPCTACAYCMPCPYGIDIPTIFRHYNDAVNAGDIAQSHEQKDFQRLKRRYLVSYDRAVATVRQADHCIGCGQCKSHCPQSIDIPRMLHRIDAYIEKLRRETL